MTVTQRLMKPGSFSVRLVPDYAFSAAGAAARFDHIVITPSPLTPIEGFSDANILAQAIYTGVITRMPSPRTFEGADLSYWLGTPDGLGNNFGQTVEVTQTMSAWISSILTSAGNGIAAGTLTNTGLSSLTGAPSWMSPREAIDWVMRATGAEYRMNPTGTLDAAKSPDLFVSTPTTVITRHEEGQDGPLRGLDGSLIVASVDVEQYTTEVQVIGAGDGSSVVVATATGSTSFKTFANGTPVFRRFVNAPTEASANAALIAAAQLGQWNQERRELALASNTYTVTRVVKPGDYTWVYDPVAGLIDPANQIVYRGEAISPIKLRVHALTWPIEEGMGVYLRKSGATPTYVDLTPFVEWENDDVRWDVGAAPRASNDVDAKLAGSTAYLGANAAVAERAALGTWLDWSTANGHATAITAAVGSVGGGTNWGSTPAADGRVRWLGSSVKAQFRMTAGGAGISAGAAGEFRVNLPIAARSSNLKIGTGVYLNAAWTIYCQFDVYLASSTQAQLFYAGAHLGGILAITDAVPFALASGCILALDIEYESA